MAPPADEAGIEAGDFITHVGRRKPAGSTIGAMVLDDGVGTYARGGGSDIVIHLFVPRGEAGAVVNVTNTRGQQSNLTSGFCAFAPTGDQFVAAS